MDTPDSRRTASITELQQSTIHLLEAVEQLLQRGESWLNKPDFYKQLTSIVSLERRKVAALELRLSIVAPIKAGKSTIINAILGAGILPTRNSAMTSIPTEIADDPHATDYILTLPEPTLRQFRGLWQKLHQAVLSRGLAASKDLAPENPEVQSLFEELGKHPTAPFASKFSGITSVQSTLLKINDLFRAAALLDGPNSLIGIKDFELPRINAKFLNSSPISKHRSGTLVIVDTPGPNEARQHHLLGQIVSEQLAQTSLVLLVLDFTQLNTQAAELVSKEVQSVARIVGEENIFVIVNKIDERDNKGMSDDQVRQFIAGHLKFRKPLPANRIFEVSAKHAFRAADYLREHGDIATDRSSLRKWPAATALAPLVFGATQWEDDLEEATDDSLAKRAQKLWARSGFDTFLTQAIERLLAEVAPRSLQVALSVARSHLTTLRNDARLRHRAIRASASTIELELTNLDRELRSLEESRRSVDARLAGVEQDLREHLKLLRRRLQPVIEEDIRLVFKSKEDSEASALQGFLKRGKRLVARHLGIPHDSVSEIVEFDTQVDAQGFANYAVDIALSKIRPQIEQALEATTRRVDSTRREFEKILTTETRPILQRAAERIKRQFDVPLEFPRPKLTNPLEKISLAHHLTKFEPGKIVTQSRREFRWYTLWLWEHEVTYSVKTKDRHLIHLDEVSHYTKQAVHKSVEEIAIKFDDFLATDFKDGIDEYFQRLREYFQFYRQTLEEAVQAQRMSLEQRDTTLKQLDALDTDSTQFLEAAINTTRTLKEMLPHSDTDSDEANVTDGLDLFISYSHKDEPLRQELEKHLSLLRREGLIHLWHDREIVPGQQWATEIDRHLESAHVILLLISADFISSEYCFATEMERAMERHAEGTAVVVPIILRACDWNTAHFGQLQALPKDAKPITSWSDSDTAFTDVARGLRKTISQMQKLRKGA
nr:dynamin family protein [Myxococcus sp. MH1]